MEKIKRLLTTESGMRTINLLFWLTIIFRNSIIILITYGLWMFFLFYSLKNTRFRIMRVLYSLFVLFAAFVMILSVISLF